MRSMEQLGRVNQFTDADMEILRGGFHDRIHAGEFTFLHCHHYSNGCLALIHAHVPGDERGALELVSFAEAFDEVVPQWVVDAAVAAGFDGPLPEVIV